MTDSQESLRSENKAETNKEKQNRLVMFAPNNKSQTPRKKLGRNASPQLKNWSRGKSGEIVQGLYKAQLRTENKCGFTNES